MAIVGAVLSIEMPPSESLELLPARSEQLPCAVCPPASAERVSELVAATTPESPAWSVQLQVTVTSLLFQPLPLAAGRRETGVIPGALLSIGMCPTLAASAAFPALSMQAPLEPTDWSAPSLESVWPATVSVAMPERTEPVSAHPKLTTTFSLFQPSLLAAGGGAPRVPGFG